MQVVAAGELDNYATDVQTLDGGEFGDLCGADRGGVAGQGSVG